MISDEYAFSRASEKYQPILHFSKSWGYLSTFNGYKDDNKGKQRTYWSPERSDSVSTGIIYITYHRNVQQHKGNYYSDPLSPKMWGPNAWRTENQVSANPSDILYLILKNVQHVTLLKIVTRYRPKLWWKDVPNYHSTMEPFRTVAVLEIAYKTSM